MNFKRCTALIFLLVFAFSTSVLGTTQRGITYTALGDSISVGIGATDNNGHVALLRDHFLRTHGAVNFLDRSTSGQTSSALRTALMTDPMVAGDVIQADVITISIGGNDFLQPLIAFVANYPMYLDPVFFAAAAANPYAHPELLGLIAALTANAEAFPGNWAGIIGTIRALNPHAVIFVNTLYNPFLGIPGLDAFAAQFLPAINGPIQGGAAMFQYRVVDVCGRFGAYQNPRFPAIHRDLSPDKFPVFLHPTDRGYLFIFNMHKDLLD